jgi:predicted O-methyltransferase YrrM
MMTKTNPSMSPEKIFNLGFGFFASKVLLTAVELEVFTVLSDKEMTAEELGQALKLHPRGLYDFFDTLLSLGFLERTGNGAMAKYRNTAETALFLDKNKPQYVGGILEMASQRLYRFWHDLPHALKTGKPQNEVKHSQKPMFEELYEDLPRLEQFMGAMTGISRGNFMALAEKVDFSPYKTLCDVGGATGILSLIVAKKYQHLQCLSFDLPQVEPIAKKHIAQEGMSGRIKTVAGDFFKDKLPKADVITMGMILHDWNLDNKKHLMRLAYEALPKGGALIAVENIIDDERRKNTFGLLMSLNMLIEFGDAFDFTFADYQSWAKEVGFSRCTCVHLAGPCSAAIAYK